MGPPSHCDRVPTRPRTKPARSLWARFVRRERFSVLIVDDEPDIRSLVRAILEDGRFDPIWEAPDGETALDLAFEHHPDVIVLDHLLPGVDGEAVARGLKLVAAGTRVVVLTGVLKEPPGWGDAFLDKTEIDQLPWVLHYLMR